MAIINKQDTDGTKAVLGKAEFGFDDYVAGGDQGRMYVGDGTVNVAIAKKMEVDEVREVLGTSTDVRYDKKLSSLDVIAMVYTDGNLTTVRYEGDDDATIYYRDVLSYVDGNLDTVKHFYGTADLITENGSTVLAYSDGNLASAAYSEV